MNSLTRTLVVAATVGVVEALKDQGICRWNHLFRSTHHYARNHVRSISQAKKLSSAVPSANHLRQSEESLRMVMYLSC
ncbi:uncharacterized protein LOC120078196 [Benincasa hispida]|uniref:uncharacterized protein LOC120078196 n=1 Tax=Benincasa hispida TaxID=102211 RepID=UPI001901A873|nr:uncharacterized protein LOC120078196 [Benincasa hispida]